MFLIDSYRFSTAAAQSIAAGAGSYAVTGSDATLRRTRIIAADAGSYAVTGSDAALRQSIYHLTADAGSYAVTGSDATLRQANFHVPAGAGSYSITGSSATLTRADPSFASVKSLLHFEGADASTTFTDQIGKTWSAFGNAQIDTAQFKYGSASGLFDGNGDYITTPDHADFDFGSGAFTVECWARWNSLAGTANQGLVEHDALGGTRGWLLFTRSADDHLTFQARVSSTDYFAIDSAAPSTATWYHIAAVRDLAGGDNIRLYRDGVQVASVAITGAINVPAVPCVVGALWNISSPAASSYFNGWMDDLRITKGVCRYPAGTTFTPPTVVFPDV